LDDGEPLIFHQSLERIQVVEANEAWYVRVERCAETPIETPAHGWRGPPARSGFRFCRAGASRCSDEKVASRSEATSDLRHEGGWIRKVLHDEDRKNTAEGLICETERFAQVVDVKRRVNAVPNRPPPSDFDHLG